MPRTFPTDPPGPCHPQRGSRALPGAKPSTGTLTAAGGAGRSNVPLGIHTRAALQVPGVPSLPDGGGRAPLSYSRSPWRSDARPRVCPPCDFTISSSPSPTSPRQVGVTPSHAVLCHVAPSFQFSFSFAVVVVLPLLVAFSHTYLVSPLSFRFLFFCPEKPDFDTKKKMKLQKLKFKKNLKKKPQKNTQRFFQLY